MASHYLLSGALMRALPGWQCPSLPLHLVTPTLRKRTARVQAFMDWAHALLLRRLGAHLDSRRAAGSLRDTPGSARRPSTCPLGQA